MPALVFALYLLLSVPIYTDIQAFTAGMDCLVCVRIETMGMRFSYEISQSLKKNGGFFYEGLFYGLRRKRKEETTASGRARRRIIGLLRNASSMRLFYARSVIGLDEAWKTAIAVGAARGALFSLLNAWPMPEKTFVNIEPEFSPIGICFHIRGIFSVSFGDVMITAVKTALKKKRKEGKRWSSIPSKA